MKTDQGSYNPPDVAKPLQAKDSIPSLYPLSKLINLISRRRRNEIETYIYLPSQKYLAAAGCKLDQKSNH